MTSYAVLLILASAILHVSWNALGKQRNPSAGFLLVANSFGGFCLLLLFLLFFELPRIPGIIVWILVGAGFAQAFYYANLASAYRVGDLSIAYPIARSAPPVFVVLVSLLLGRSDQISTQCMIGIAGIVCGGVILPLQRFSDLNWNNFRNACAGFALLAAMGTATYSLLDDHGLRLLRETPDLSMSAVHAVMFYAPMEALTASIFLGFWVAIRREERVALREVLSEHKIAAAFTGCGIYASYTLVLTAMAYADDVSYVVGLRQISVPLGALVGIRLLGEASSTPKWTGVAFTFVGLTLVATG
ncbi:MAG: hypothetical protein GY725_11400 [bacterium]|nr:hypothetical protein [bacterium]